MPCPCHTFLRLCRVSTPEQHSTESPCIRLCCSARFLLCSKRRAYSSLTLKPAPVSASESSSSVLSSSLAFFSGRSATTASPFSSRLLAEDLRGILGVARCALRRLQNFAEESAAKSSFYSGSRLPGSSSVRHGGWVGHYGAYEHSRAEQPRRALHALWSSLSCAVASLFGCFEPFSLYTPFRSISPAFHLRHG
jgi:hypothetical protein